MAATSDSLEASPASAVGTAAGRPEAPLASMKKRPLEARWEEAMAATKKSRAVSSATADTPHTVVFKEGKVRCATENGEDAKAQWRPIE